MNFEDIAQTSTRFTDALTALDAELRPRYEEILWATGPSRLALASAGMVRSAVRSASLIASLCENGFSRDAVGPLRTSIENATNLLYILHTGPANGKRSREDLAEQFLHHGETQRKKLFDKALPKDASATTVEMWEELLRHRNEVRVRAEEAVATYPELEKTMRWHPLSFEKMFNAVAEEMPPYLGLIPEFWSSLPGEVASANFLLHASSFTMSRDPASMKRGAMLNQEFWPSPLVEFYSSYLAFLCWQAVAEVFGGEGAMVEARYWELLKSALASPSATITVSVQWETLE